MADLQEALVARLLNRKRNNPMTASQKQNISATEQADEIRSLKCEQEISRKLQERIDQIDFGEK